jgi:hypothetical protein
MKEYIKDPKHWIKYKTSEAGGNENAQKTPTTFSCHGP